MREIKFRVWYKKERFMEDLTWPFAIIDNEQVFDLRTGRELSSDVEILQYTESKDKNGKEIYEGDIVSGWISDIEHDKLLSVGKIMFVDGAFGIFSISNNFIGDLSSCTLNKSIKIIGNVYENPELFKLK